MWNYNPRTTGGHIGRFYLPQVASTDGRIGGTWTRTYSTADFNGICTFLINYATDTDPNTFAVGDGDQRGYGYNYLELEAADTATPIASDAQLRRRSPAFPRTTSGFNRAPSPIRRARGPLARCSGASAKSPRPV